MNVTIQDLIDDARTLPIVPLKEAALYHENISDLTRDVDESMRSLPTINTLIGHNPLQVMYDNHRNHAAFMAAVFSIGSYELLVQTLPWVYRSYSAHRFSYDYFPLELQAWIDAIEKKQNQSMQTIVAVYQWMIQKHEAIVFLSNDNEKAPPPVDEQYMERKNSFQAGLLRGDHTACLDIARETVGNSRDIEGFYLHIIQPSMYEIGMLWERASISVAQEHLASAIVSRIMAAVNMTALESKPHKCKAVISSAPNEFHEIGAWMIADVLTCEGWDIRYLGANTPHDALMDLLKSFKPDHLGLSVTMAFNVEKVREMIREIKNDPSLKSISIIVGGRVFNDIPDLWKKIGADGFASNLSEARRLFEKKKS